MSDYLFSHGIVACLVIVGLLVCLVSLTLATEEVDNGTETEVQGRQE